MVRKKFNKKEILLGFLITIFVISILTFYIWHQMESVRIGYETGELEKRINTLIKKIEILEVKKSHLLSLEKVEKIAIEELNLAKPKENQIIYDDFHP
ncbi:MAG: cell division protein FtsL [Candidatus Aminicenantes bacterium]|jgi:cell division protein FtsL|nr:cell division protein FtsL [Candidatus Aminicenantes bacterium]